jgi:hypothetical protein
MMLSSASSTLNTVAREDTPAPKKSVMLSSSSSTLNAVAQGDPPGT